jgi:hypothetical protein
MPEQPPCSTNRRRVFPPFSGFSRSSFTSAAALGVICTRGSVVALASISTEQRRLEEESCQTPPWCGEEGREEREERNQNGNFAPLFSLLSSIF